MLLRRLFSMLLLLFTLSFMEVSAQQYLEFIENKGQWPSAIKFQAQTVAGAFALQNNGYRVLVHNPQDLAALNTHPREKNHVATTPENFDGVLHSHAYEVKFLNANPNPTIVPEKIQPSYNNYFIGNDSTKWASDCKIYKAVVYKDLYPGIDIRYYTNDAQLKYDIIVHPGADVSKIALYIEGADGIKLKNRALEIKTRVTTVSELAPYTYQLKKDGKKEVNCDYTVKGNIVKFSIAGDYDKTETLVIDPSFNTSDPCYFGEQSKEDIMENLTGYANMVLLSFGEAHPFVCLEAMSAGLGLVLSEQSTANLDLSQPFITVIPEDKSFDVDYIREKIQENRSISLTMRKKIREYCFNNFDWSVIIGKYKNIIKGI